MALYYRRRRIFFFFFVIFPLLILLFFIYIILQITPAFINLSEDKVYSVAFTVINKVISEELGKINAENLIDYKYDTDGKIVAVNANISTMNKLNNAISGSISRELSNIEKIYVDLPLGSFISNNFFSALGPKIPVEIIPLENITSEYQTEFTSTGINQTRHRIFITVTCNVGILSSLVKTDQEIKIQIPIVETIIVGNVPTTYFDFDNR